MHAGMDGPHQFLIAVKTTHPNAPRAEFLMKAFFG